LSSANPNNVDAVVSEDADAAELRAFGYWQQLRRSMGVFSSFAISFSMVSIITGVFAHFDFGFKQAGPTVLWSWSVVGAGQFLIALVLADLSSRIPLSGSGYQWSTRLVNPHYGFFVGWLILMQLLTGFPGVCHTLATALCNSLGAESNSPALVVGVAVGTISAIALVHLVGIRVVSFVNDLGVMAEVAACSLLIVVLFGAYFLDGPASLSRFLDRTHAPTGQPAGPSALALSLLMGAWCLTGFEAAADLAEETQRPKQTVPWVILSAELSSALGGLLLLAGIILAIPDVHTAGQQEHPLLTTLTASLGSKWINAAMVVILVSIFACGVASMAAATRLIYSLARDNMLPMSNALKRVHPRLQTPISAIVVVWMIAVAVVLGFDRLELFTDVSAVAAYLGYSGIVIASFREKSPSTGFSLGRYRSLVRIAALAWSIFVVAALTIPDVATSDQAIHHLPAKSTLVAIGVGTAIYSLFIRGRLVRGEAGPPQTGVGIPR
jgi:amino acid transporter